MIVEYRKERMTKEITLILISFKNLTMIFAYLKINLFHIIIFFHSEHALFFQNINKIWVSITF